MISKSYNWYVNRKLTTREFQKYQNYQILIYILRVIDPASQRSNSYWKWIVVGQTLNWGAKWSWNFTNFLSTKSWWNKESNETKIKWFRPNFKISKNSNQMWAKMKNKSTLNAKLTI